MILFTWAFHALVFHAWGLASGSSGSRTSRYGLLVYVQGASDSLPHSSPWREVGTSVFGVAVRALLLATSLPLGMDVSLAPGRSLSVSTFYGLRLCPYGSCSEVPGPPVLLSSYAARVISCGAGVLSSLSPFLGCLSGSSELGWSSVELLRTSDGHFSFLNALFVLASASTRRFGYSMLCLSVALFPGARVGCPLLSSQALWLRLRPLPCSSVCGLQCTGPTNARQSQWETVISCAVSQVVLVRLGGASSGMRAVHVAAGCSMKEGSSILVSFWLRMPLSRGCWLSVMKRSVLCPLRSVHSCCRSVSSL